MTTETLGQAAEHNPDQAPEQTDEKRAEAFAGRMLGVLSDACLALSVSIGHQVGLFDTMAAHPGATSEELASSAGLNERYVREWLGTMTTARVVEYDPGARRYALPPEHAGLLTRAAGLDNIARTMQFVPMLAEVEQAVVECFRNGGGVPYSAYPRFQRLMAEDSAAIVDATLVDTVLPLVDGLPERLAAGIDVADVGCGQGHAINVMARAFPRSRFTGYDISAEGIATARHEAAEMGLDNATFEVRDAATLDVTGAFDLVTAFDAIHDQAHPARVLAGIAGALRPGGTFLMVDIKASSRVEENIEVPWAPFLYTVSTMHCMTVSLAEGGTGLGTVWGRQLAERMLADAGLTTVAVKDVEGDFMNSFYIAVKPGA